MSGKEDIQFIKFIGERLSTEETRNLWMPMASEYERPDGGLDAVAVWLEAERSTLITPFVGEPGRIKRTDQELVLCRQVFE